MITITIDPASPGGIARIRGALGLTQTELAKRLGVSRRTVCHWEDGSATPNEKRLDAIAELAAR